MSKRIGKFRQEDDYYQDEWGSNKSIYEDNKKRKKKYSENRKMKNQEYFEESYGYMEKRQRYAK